MALYLASFEIANSKLLAAQTNYLKKDALASAGADDRNSQ
jgi:hypothetical protein